MRVILSTNSLSGHAGAVQTLGYQVGGKMIYFHKDRQDSVLAMSNDAGDKEAFYRYDPYGQPRDYFRWSDEAKANTLMYVGLPRDFSTGLIRMGARWYDPSIARFTTADPSGQEQNPYLYAAANPINNTDPSGLSVQGRVFGGLVGGMFGAGVMAFGGSVGLALGVAGFVSSFYGDVYDQDRSGGSIDYGAAAADAAVDSAFGYGLGRAFTWARG